MFERVRAGTPVRQIAAEAGVSQSALGKLLKRRFDYVPTPFRRPTLAVPDDPAVRAYIAGIIDGEGSICFLNKHWCVKVAMTDENVIRWLHSFGGHFDLHAQSKQLRVDGSPRKQAFAWNVHRYHDVIHLLTAIAPYMIVKRAKAEEVLTTLRLKTAA